MVEKAKHDPGTFCWVELATSDGAAAKKFYTLLFGWHFDDVQGGGGMYTMLRGEDCDGTVDKAKRLAANVTIAPMDIETVGRFAMLTDPQRAAFAVIKLTGA